ncbi:hypothetical protein Tco_0771141 [Tanacetum coccineum]|uniref:Uncharacterized protein n=1 Tax=Tanacetum coccineum TaxID=301880 RepID=A0ABQ4ZF57_9ASTR
MTRNYFLQYTQLDIPEFRETLVQFMEYVKESIDERALHKREHDSRVNERQMQTTMEKVDTSKALDASSVIIKRIGTESQEQDTRSRSGNDAHVDDANIRHRHTYEEELKAENAEQCLDTCPLPAKLTDDKTIELSNQLLESENETDIQEKDKNKAKNNKTEHENEKSVKRSQSQSPSQPRQIQRRVKSQNTTLGTEFAKSLKLDFKDLKTKVVFITLGAKSANSLSYIPQGLNLQDHIYHGGTSSANPAKFYTTRTYGVIT